MHCIHIPVKKKVAIKTVKITMEDSNLQWWAKLLTSLLSYISHSLFLVTSNGHVTFEKRVTRDCNRTVTYKLDSCREKVSTIRMVCRCRLYFFGPKVCSIVCIRHIGLRPTR